MKKKARTSPGSKKTFLMKRDSKIEKYPRLRLDLHMNVYALLNQKGETILVDLAIIPDLKKQKASGEGVIFVSDINDTLHLVDLREQQFTNETHPQS